MKDEHFAGLLDDLCALHDAGLVHRDIRLANILVVGGVAKLIDFGYARAPVTEWGLRGTQTTASQAILRAALQPGRISYRPEDDMESLLKAYVMHGGHVVIDYDTGKWGIWAVYDSWTKVMDVGDFETRTYAGMVSHLRTIFGRKREPWEDKWIRERASRCK